MQLGSFLSGMAAGGLLVYGAVTHHVLHTKDGFTTVPRLQPSFSDMYLDVREFGISDWNRHRDLAAAIVAAHKEQIFTQNAHQTVTQGVSDFLREWTRLRQAP